MAGSNITEVLFPREEIEELRSRLDAASGPIAVTTVVSPVLLLRAAAALFQSAQLICDPAGTVVAGLGIAWEVKGSGIGRFDAIDRRLPAAPGSEEAPVFMGFAFRSDGPHSPEWDGFANCTAVVPQIAIVDNRRGRRLVLTPAPGADSSHLVALLGDLVHPGEPATFEPGDHSVFSHPASAEWRTEVDEAVGAIQQGAIAKVVLSRSVLVTTENVPRPFDLVEHLRTTYPQCFVFAWQAGDATFLGASPELLLRKSGMTVRANPLAGSARRGEGEADDRALGEALMHSAKDRQEHSLVVEDIAARLAPLVTELSISAQPALRRMATVQHLSTEISGGLHDRVRALQLVDAMHPTPAVGGTPRAAALAFVDKIEGIDRGWYTGGIGWLEKGGDATFAIPLRCALIAGRHSRLYAGAGIVADSKPDGELDETRLKFRPMLNLLTVS